MTMARYVPQLPAPVSLSMEKPLNPILLSGCNFNYCTISFSGNTTASLGKHAFSIQNRYLFIDCSIENGIVVVYWEKWRN